MGGAAMLPKLSIFCIIHIIRITLKAEIIPDKVGLEVSVPESELKDLRAKRDELATLKTTHASDKQAWKTEVKKLQDENKELKEEILDLKDENAQQNKRVWSLMWFRWLTMIKNEIEWRETTVTNFTFNRKLFEEQKAKNKVWTEGEEYRRQVWNCILENCTDQHIISLQNEIDKNGIEYHVFSKNIAFAHRDISFKLLSMLRWCNLPKFEKEPSFNTPISWSHEANKCLLTLMFDVRPDMVWNFQTDLAIEQAPEEKT